MGIKRAKGSYQKSKKPILINELKSIIDVIDRDKNEKNKLRNSLIITDKNSKLKIIKSARNIPNLKIIEQEGTNAYDILKYKNIIFTTSSIKNFQERIKKV